MNAHRSYCSKTMLTGEFGFHTSTPPPPGDWTQVPHDGKQTGSKRVDHWTSGTVYEWSEVGGSPQGSPPSSRLCLLSSRKEDLPRAVNPGQRAVWDQVGFSHCRYDGLVTVWNEARLRWGHNDQSRQGHQCSKTMITGESQFHISTPWGLNPGPSWQEAKGWTTGPVELCMNAVRLQAFTLQRFWHSNKTPRHAKEHSSTQNALLLFSCIFT